MKQTHYNCNLRGRPCKPHQIINWTKHRLCLTSTCEAWPSSFTDSPVSYQGVTGIGLVVLAAIHGVTGIGLVVLSTNHGVTGIGLVVPATLLTAATIPKPIAAVKIDSASTAATIHLFMTSSEIGKLPRRSL